MPTEEELKAAALKVKEKTGDKEKLQIEGIPDNFYDLPKEKQTEILTDLSKKGKQVDEKEAMLQKQGNEVGDLRNKLKEVEPILEQIKAAKDGKTSTNDIDKVLEKFKDKYDPNDLQTIKDLVIDVVDLKNKETNSTNRKLLANVLTSVVDMSIAHDPDIDKNLYKDNKESILTEYNRYKDPGTIDEMKTNLKEAYLKVQLGLVRKARAEGKAVFDKERDERILGAGPEPEGGHPKDTRSETDKIRDGIVDAGGAEKKGVFG